MESPCAENQKKILENTINATATKYGKAAANAAISAERSAIDGMKSLMQAQLTVLQPLAALDNVFQGMISYPLDIVQATYDATVGQLVVPIHQIGAAAGKCSDTRETAQSIEDTISGLSKDIDKLRGKVNKLNLIKSDELIKRLTRSIDHLDFFKLDPIP